jgi:hypothetical protein
LSLLGIEFAGYPAKLVCRFVAELHQMLRHHRQLGTAVVDPLRQHLEQRFERARLGAHSDHRPVKRSASLRRVRPNISQARPSSASGPVAIATHSAIAGEVSGSPPSARPADQAV